MYDIIIIGAGPAGFTAGIYAARRAMKTLIISKDEGGQLAWASDIENYPGFEKIDSFDLVRKMSEHVKNLSVPIISAEVKKIEKKDDGSFSVYTVTEEYQAQTVVLCMGLAPRRLEIKGEKEYSGKGVSYCANCDGPLYKNKVIAVVGGGNSALDAAEYLAKIAQKVYLIHRTNEFKAFESLIEKVRQDEKIEILLEREIKGILGDGKVEKIIVKGGETESELAVDGVFIEVGRVAHTDLAEGLADRNERKEILADELCRTKTAGLFAAGDVTQVAFKQITIACGQATIAALAAYQYIQAQSGESGIISDRSIVRKK